MLETDLLPVKQRPSVADTEATRAVEQGRRDTEHD
jgi:hypothetical protein